MIFTLTQSYYSYSLHGKKQVLIISSSAPSHSPGNMALKISSGDDNLICIGDIFHHPEEIEHTNLYTAPLMTKDGRATREKILSQDVNLHALVFACHFPFPGLGHIIRKEAIYTWEPVYNV